MVKKYRQDICWVSPTVSKIWLLKYRREFCIRNPRLFLNHCSYFYTFILSCTFTLRKPILLFILVNILPPPDWPMIRRASKSAYVGSSAHGTGLHTRSTSFTLLSSLRAKGLTRRCYVWNNKYYMLALSLLNLKSGTKHTNHKLHMCHMDHQHNYYRLLTARVLQQFFQSCRKKSKLGVDFGNSSRCT